VAPHYMLDSSDFRVGFILHPLNQTFLLCMFFAKMPYNYILLYI